MQFQGSQWPCLLTSPQPHWPDTTGKWPLMGTRPPPSLPPARPVCLHACVRGSEPCPWDPCTACRPQAHCLLLGRLGGGVQGGGASPAGGPYSAGGRAALLRGGGGARQGSVCLRQLQPGRPTSPTPRVFLCPPESSGVLFLFFAKGNPGRLGTGTAVESLQCMLPPSRSSFRTPFSQPSLGPVSALT